MSNPIVVARLVLLVVGVLVWGYGYRYDVPEVRLVAIAILFVAVLMRFLPKRPRNEDV